MSEAGGGAPTPGDILAGILIILFGLCFLLVGGGCTVFWLSNLSGVSELSGGFGWIMLFVSVAAAAFGVFSTLKGVQRVRGPHDGGGGTTGNGGGGEGS